MIDTSAHAGTSTSRTLGLAVGFVFLIFNLWTYRQAYLLKHEGMPIQGTVTAAHIVRRKGSVSYNTEYRYNVSGRSYTGTADINRYIYLTLRPEGPVALRYVPSAPDISEAWDMAHSSTTLFLTMALGIPVSLLILILAFRQGGRVSEKLEPLALSEEPVQDRDIVLPNMVKGIAFSMYPVTDMKRARKFYEEDLGLKVAKDYHGEWIEYYLWENCFAITNKTDIRPSAESGGSVALEVQDVDEFVKELRKKGIRIKTEPFSTPACRMAVIVDPEGNALTLHQRKRK